MSASAKFIISLVVLPFHLLLEAWGFHLTWNWFAPDWLPAITFVQSLGLVMIITAAARVFYFSPNADDDDIFLGLILRPFVAWPVGVGVAWVVHMVLQ